MFSSKQFLSQAIILSITPRKITLFDAFLGKIDVLTPRHKGNQIFVRGGLIEYTHAYLGKHMVIVRSSLENCFFWGKQKEVEQLLFVQHSLEIAHFFLAYNQPQQEAYAVFSLIYTDKVLYGSQLIQKIVIIRFLALIGIYPSQASFYPHNFFSLIFQPLDTMLEIQECSELHEYINAWLYSCLSMHSQVFSIKTLHFLRR